jgi:hypothetical protein
LLTPSHSANDFQIPGTHLRPGYGGHDGWWTRVGRLTPSAASG